MRSIQAPVSGFVGALMKKLLLAGVAALFAIPAVAADLPTRKAPALAPVSTEYDWTGSYFGGNLGGSWGSTNSSFYNLSNGAFVDGGSANASSFVGGGQIGCDYQFASTWVVGVEGRAAWSSLNSQTPGRGLNPITGITFPTHFTVRNDFLASATARLGYSFVGGWLIYARGRAAWTREKEDSAFTDPFYVLPADPKGTQTRAGWTAGAGLDWAFAPHWSTNVEYGYYDFGDNNYLLTGPVVGFTGNLKDRIHTVTVGLNYHF